MTRNSTAFANKQVNIFIDSMGRFKERHIHEYSAKGACIRAVGRRHFEVIVNNLPPETPILIFIHLEVKNNGSAPPGLDIGVALKNKYKILNQKGLIYLSSDDQTRKHYPGLEKNDKVELFPSFEDLLLTEKPVLIKELLSSPSLKSIDEFEFDNKLDWNVNRLLNEVDEQTLCEIVGTVLGDETYDEYRIDVLTSGFSGAFVLKLSCTKNKKTDYYLLKIATDDTELEAERKNGKLPKLAQNGKSFITAINHHWKFQIKGWSCLLFHFENKATLKSQMVRMLEEEPARFLLVAEQVIRDFDQQFYDILSVENEKKFLLEELSPFRGGEFFPYGERLTFEGLKLNPQKVVDVQRALRRILEEYPLNVLKRYDIDKAIARLLSFLDFSYDLAREPFISAFKREKIPVGYVHGDFHLSNILIDEEGKYPAYIDLVNVPIDPVKHAFLDVGKFSTDLEISVLTNKILVEQPQKVRFWMDYHQSWLNQKPLNRSEFSELNAIYDAITWILQFLQDQFTPQLPKSSILRQFHLVRLHYFLKAIGYFYEEREKIFFLVRASSDILDYLENDQP